MSVDSKLINEEELKQKRMTALQKAREKKQAENGIVQFTNPIARWENSDKKSRQMAINANCAGCMGCTKDHLEPGFKRFIAECSILDCPLHSFRPYQPKNKNSLDID